MLATGSAPNGDGMGEFDPDRLSEFEQVAASVSWRVIEGSLPPDDAYWWARIVCEMARKLDAPPSDS